MSLDYDYRECDDALIPDEFFERHIQNIVFNTMFVGINHITEENYIEFALRMGIHDAAQGYSVDMHATDRVDIVRCWIGLRTNASPMSPTVFFNRMRQIAADKEKSIRMNLTRERPVIKLTKEKVTD